MNTALVQRIAIGKNIDSLASAVSIAGRFVKNRDEFILSRGQMNYSWGLQPSVLRLERWYRNEHLMTRELISTHPQEFVDDRPMVDRLVRMQHYGLPTRLLDVSENFLVSLYMASEGNDSGPDGSIYVIRGDTSRRRYYDSDIVSLIANLANISGYEKNNIFHHSPDNGEEIIDGVDSFNRFQPVDRLLQFVRDEKPYFRPKIVKSQLFDSYLVIPKKSNRRIVAQSGAFLISGLVGRDRLPTFKGFDLTKYRVPAAAKDEIRKGLEGLGITESALYPEIDKAASYIARRYRT